MFSSRGSNQNVLMPFCNVSNPANNYLFKFNNENSRATREICSKLTIKTPEKCPTSFMVVISFKSFVVHNVVHGVFIDNFKQISHVALVFPLVIWTSKCWMGKCCEDLNLLYIFATFKPKFISYFWNWGPMNYEFFWLSPKTLPKQKQPSNVSYKKNVLKEFR